MIAHLHDPGPNCGRFRVNLYRMRCDKIRIGDEFVAGIILSAHCKSLFLYNKVTVNCELTVTLTSEIKTKPKIVLAYQIHPAAR